MCESEQMEAPKGAYYLTLIPEKDKVVPSLEELEQRRLVENVEIERSLDYLIQKAMNERT